MPARKSLVSTFWVMSTLALLASILSSPIRTSGLVTVTSRADCFSRDRAFPPAQPTTRISSATSTDADPPVSALMIENEEQDWIDALDRPQVSCLVVGYYRKLLDPPFIALRSVLSLYPLRC